MQKLLQKLFDIMIWNEQYIASCTVIPCGWERDNIPARKSSIVCMSAGQWWSLGTCQSGSFIFKQSVRRGIIMMKVHNSGINTFRVILLFPFTETPNPRFCINWFPCCDHSLKSWYERCLSDPFSTQLYKAFWLDNTFVLANQVWRYNCFQWKQL